MITTVSALLHPKTRDAIFSHEGRAQVVASLAEAGLPERTIANALNCSRDIVSSFPLQVTASRRRPVYPPEDVRITLWDLRAFNRNSLWSLYYKPPTTEVGKERENEKLAGHLAAEIRRWLCSMNLTDLERREVINKAGLVLDHSPLNRDSQYEFQVNRVTAEILGIWRPASDAKDSNTASLFGRWLASWMRFWIVNTSIWYRALDLEF